MKMQLERKTYILEIGSTEVLLKMEQMMLEKHISINVGAYSKKHKCI